MNRLRMRRWQRAGGEPAPARRRRRVKREFRRAGLRLLRRATGGVRSTLEQFERETHLAPF